MGPVAKQDPSIYPAVDFYLQDKEELVF